MGIFNWLKKGKQGTSISEQVARINEANICPAYNDSFYTTIENGVVSYHRKRKM